MDQAVNIQSNRTRKILALFIVVFLLFFLTSCRLNESTLNNDNFKWWDYILVYPIGWLMGNISGIFGNNYGVGIILTTIIIRTISWPIYSKSNDMSLKMNLMQPEMQRVQAKYANRQDRESQQRMQMEMQQVYKKHKINMLGCLMPLVQMPIFIAVYQTVQRIWIASATIGDVEVTGLWAHKVANMNFLSVDLAKSGNLQYFFNGFTDGDWKGWILAVIVAGTNILLNWLSTRKPSYQKDTHKHGAGGQQAQQSQQMMKYMQIFMVIMMFGIALTSNALALYWIVGNIYSIGQNLINRKINEKKYYAMKNKDLVVINYDEEN